MLSSLFNTLHDYSRQNPRDAAFYLGKSYWPRLCRQIGNKNRQLQLPKLSHHLEIAGANFHRAASPFSDSAVTDPRLNGSWTAS
ncbi:MAG: hypothetical protein EBT10_06880 [Methylocystaceae bacterium]|nr:hypothetical protein [Methylocystaceae bacterium]